MMKFVYIIFLILFSVKAGAQSLEPHLDWLADFNNNSIAMCEGNVNSPGTKCPEALVELSELNNKSGYGKVKSPIKVCFSARGFNQLSVHKTEAFLESTNWGRLGGHSFYDFDCSKEFIDPKINQSTALEYRNAMAKLNEESKSLVQEIAEINNRLGIEHASGIECSNLSIADSKEFCRKGIAKQCDNFSLKNHDLKRLNETGVPVYQKLLEEKKSILNILASVETDRHTDRAMADQYNKKYLEVEQKILLHKANFPYIDSTSFQKELSKTNPSQENIEQAYLSEMQDRKKKALQILNELQSTANCLSGDHKAANCSDSMKVVSGLPSIETELHTEKSFLGQEMQSEFQKVQCAEDQRKKVKANRREMHLTGLMALGGGIGLYARSVGGAALLAVRAGNAAKGLTYAARLSQARKSAQAFVATGVGKAAVATFGLDVAFFSDSVKQAINACGDSILRAEKRKNRARNALVCPGGNEKFREYKEQASDCMMNVMMTGVDAIPFVPLSFVLKVSRQFTDLTVASERGNFTKVKSNTTNIVDQSTPKFRELNDEVEALRTQFREERKKLRASIERQQGKALREKIIKENPGILEGEIKQLYHKTLSEMVENKMKDSKTFRDLLQSRQRYFEEINHNLPDGLKIDFSSHEAFEFSLARVRALKGSEIVAARELLRKSKSEVPDVIVRRDKDIYSQTSSSSLRRKSYLDDEALHPANINGETGPFRHIAKSDNETLKSDSAFTSFSNSRKLEEGSSRFGGQTVKIQLRELLSDVEKGHVRGVDVFTNEMLIKQGKQKLQESLIRYKHSDVKFDQFYEEMHQISMNYRKNGGNIIENIIEFLKRNNISTEEKGMIDSINFLRHVIVNDEILVRGQIPMRYIDVN